jgi:integrase
MIVVNMTSVDEYIKKLKANRVSDSTIENYNRILNKLNEYKPLESMTSKDLQDFFNTLNCKENTFVLYQAVTKKYFKDIGKPEVAAWIKRINPKETLHSDDILTTDEINKMLEYTDSHYYKALIAFLYETGCRISEARLLRYADFNLNIGTFGHYEPKLTP